ncbi:MAG: Gfo/Idh/MocA family oxidoreductase [Candidatus Aenigmarchaeota archaeon]|nr:Gfo/Idh/MocA family oxidoreductase [Candidatus Aenigmarchaeota archaeon]
MISFPDRVPDQIRVGLVGPGPEAFIVQHHINAMRETGLFDITGAVCQNAKFCGWTAKNLRIPESRVDLNLNWLLHKVALMEETPDIIDIATPTHLHAEQVMLALDHVDMVVCDKPLVTTWKEFCAIRDKMDTSQSIVITYNHRFFEPVQRLRAMVNDAKSIGCDIDNVSSWFFQQWLLEDPKNRQSAWRKVHPLGGAWDIWTHAYDLMSTVLGCDGVDVSESSLVQNGAHGGAALDTGDCIVTFGDDRQANIGFSQAKEGHQDDIGSMLRIEGVWWMWRLEMSGGDVLWMSTAPEPSPWNMGDWKPIFRGSEEAFKYEESAAFEKTPPGHSMGWPDAWYTLWASIAGYYYQVFTPEFGTDNLHPAMLLDIPLMDEGGEQITKFVLAAAKSFEQEGADVSFKSIEEEDDEAE